MEVQSIQSQDKQPHVYLTSRSGLLCHFLHFSERRKALLFTRGKITKVKQAIGSNRILRLGEYLMYC